MNQFAKELIDGMNETVREYQRDRMGSDPTSYAQYLSARDQLHSNWKERAAQCGVNPQSDEFLVAWALAAYSADEHIQQFCEVIHAKVGLNLHDMFPPGMIMHSLWELTRG